MQGHYSPAGMKQASAGAAASLALNFLFTDSNTNAEGPLPVEIASTSDVCVATDRVPVETCSRSSLLVMKGAAAQRMQKYTSHAVEGCQDESPMCCRRTPCI